jgi:prolyl-tRNA editing enzyme YbaK/EbsC (Cys-tRNA(Pro) deacylase)
MALIDAARAHGFEDVAFETRLEHVPATVAADLPREGVIVFPVPDQYADTAAFCEHFKCSMDDSANTLILKFTKEGGEHYAAVVALGSRRLDVNGLVRRYLGAQRLTFAKRDVATEMTQMEFGGITAFGLPRTMRILVDEPVMQRAHVVMGAGFRRTKLFLAPALLQSLPLVEVAQLS